MTGTLPYNNFRTDIQVSLAIIQGKLPSKPNNVDSWPVDSQRIWNIIESCWKDVSERPGIRELLGELRQEDDVPEVSGGSTENRFDDALHYGSPTTADPSIDSHLGRHRMSADHKRQSTSGSSTLISPTHQDDPSIEGSALPGQKSDLAMHCFTIMEEGLHFNMCGLKTSFVQDMEVSDLRYRMMERISTNLQHACISWFRYLVESPVTARLLDALAEFAYERLLFWFEVMSFLRKFRIVVSQALLRVASWAVSRALQLYRECTDIWQETKPDTFSILEGCCHFSRRLC